MVLALSNRISAGLEARRTAEMFVAGMRAASEAGNTSKNAPSTIERREPADLKITLPEDVAERVAKNRALSKLRETDRGAWLDELAKRPSIPGVTDRLPPAYDGEMTRFDNHVSKVYSEIKIDGKVVARFYNGGGAEYAGDYAFLAKDVGTESIVGPDLAEQRMAKAKSALEARGIVVTDSQNAPLADT